MAERADDRAPVACGGDHTVAALQAASRESRRARYGSRTPPCRVPPG